MVLKDDNPADNRKTLEAMFYALNPLFNLDIDAFNEKPAGHQDLTIQDWLNHNLVETTLQSDRTFNGLFFINEAGEDHVIKKVYPVEDTKHMSI